MTENTTWLITGAGLGMGVDIVKPARTAGHAVAATGRDLSTSPARDNAKAQVS
jgi:NADP-dependent 3-hydroxy acid dehydrogenase YdfG